MNALEANSCGEVSEGYASTTSPSNGEDSIASTTSSPSLKPAAAESTKKAVSPAPTVAANFEGVDPSFILPQLLELPPCEVIGGKPFWKTYTRWDKLDADQKGKALLFWNNSINDATRERVLATAREKIAAGVSEEKARQAITSKHDKVSESWWKAKQCVRLLN